MKRLTWPAVAALVVLFAAAACGATAEDVRREADARYQRGEITKEERNAVHETIDATPASPWRAVGEGVLWSLGTLLAGYFGLRRLGSRTGLTRDEAAALRSLIPASRPSGPTPQG